jgi:hypothetical protein
MEPRDRAVATTAHPAAAKARATAWPMPPSEHPVTSTTGRDRSGPSPQDAAIAEGWDSWLGIGFLG